MGREPTLHTNANRAIEKLKQEPPLRKLERCAELLKENQGISFALRRIRSGAIGQLRREGWTINQIAAHLGVTKGRVSHLQVLDYYEGLSTSSGNLTVEEQTRRRAERARLRVQEGQRAADEAISALYRKPNQEET